MNQHPVPQNVTQYQFRLVGDMTLKQFLELAGGLVLAVLFYSTNLIFIFKWPLILLSIFFGIALAFFPIEDRPLDQWIVNFIHAIYKPTRFIWTKTNKIPNIFTFSAHPIAPTNTVTKTIKAPTLRPTKGPETDLSEKEAVKVKSLNSLFTNLPPAIQDAPQLDSKPATDVIYDKPSVTVRKLKPQAAAVAPPVTPPKKVVVPKVEPTVVPPQATSTGFGAPLAGSVPDNLIFASSKKGSVQDQKSQAPAAQKLKSITLPVAPRSPNLIVGVATTPDGKLVEGAIVQVLDQSGVPARAMKTNALGQFATSTPLSPGSYRIEVESDEHTFPAQQININNQIVAPFEIRAIA